MHLARMSRRRHLILQVLVIAFLFSQVLDIAKILHCLSNHTEDTVFRRPERIYIASLHWNNEKILRSHWNNAVVALAEALGRENVFIAVYESGSSDDTVLCKTALTSCASDFCKRPLSFQGTLATLSQSVYC